MATQEVRLYKWTIVTPKVVRNLEELYIEQHSGREDSFQSYRVMAAGGCLDLAVRRFAFRSNAEQFAHWLQQRTGLPLKQKATWERELDEELEEHEREVASRRQQLSKEELKVWDAFTKAVRKNSPKRVSGLAQGGLRLTGRDPEEQQTPLLWAVDYQRLEIARILIAAGADVNLEGDSSGLTQLMLACSAGDLGMVQLLLAHCQLPPFLDRSYSKFEAARSVAEPKWS